MSWWVMVAATGSDLGAEGSCSAKVVKLPQCAAMAAAQDCLRSSSGGSAAAAAACIVVAPSCWHAHQQHRPIFGAPRFCVFRAQEQRAMALNDRLARTAGWDVQAKGQRPILCKGAPG